MAPDPEPAAQAYFHKVAHLKGVYGIALNRPKSRNAISVQLLKLTPPAQDLECALEQASADPSIQCLIFHSSTPGCFCSGADLIERRQMTDADVHRFLADLRRVFSRIDHLAFPSICAIDGPALGGGLELALACDFRIAARNVTKISFPETRLGIIPGGGGTQRAPRLIGMTKAKELIFTGRELTAADAQELGLVDYVADHSQSAYDRALLLAAEISKSAPLALRAAKAAISRSLEFSLDDALDYERSCYEPLLKTQDRTEALDAFREKRAPVFIGK
ncbi:ClpP/crotonase-like domain-containing protein [Schizophyllum amplum]|uniref:ClpP/crotonase-like domain-containing protein n=1 Tax=Schizophyllum amplum TaxID=97359 RepID=A0A550C3K9_9AGAR|nr:ClpP/crotonase-like domain-containing protein [Auriculariopsis ampla]